MKKQVSQTLIYLIYSGATAFFFSLVFTVSQIYRIETLGLNPFQLVLVGTVLEASCFIFEIPTGILADIKSRKLSVIIGLVLIGLAFTIEGAVPLFEAAIFSQVLWGIGYTFTSGADEAWIADELGGEGLEGIYLKGAQVGQIFSLTGIIVGTIIGSKAINLPMIIGGILFIILGVFLIFFMREDNFTPASSEGRNSFRQMMHTFRQGVKFIRMDAVLIIMLGISFLYGLYSEGFDRLWTAHFLTDTGFPSSVNLKPVVWIGIIDGAAMLLSILAVQYVKKRMERTGSLERVGVLTIMNVIMVITIILFGLSGKFGMALSMYFIFYIIRTTNGPIFRAWMNRNIKSEVRATVLSTYGQIDSMGQIIGGPLIGFIALKTSISTAIITSGVILSPIIFLLIYSSRKHYTLNGD